MRGKKGTSSTIADFWANVDKRGPNDCWPWTGNTNGGTGYGAMRVNGVLQNTHVLAWEDANCGSLLPGWQVNHRCDNKACCNPGHLYAGTHRDNMKDRAKRGAVPNYKLSVEKAVDIRADTRTNKQIAADYGVSVPTISAIKRGEHWNHDGGESA